MKHALDSIELKHHYNIASLNARYPEWKHIITLVLYLCKQDIQMCHKLNAVYKSECNLDGYSYIGETS